MYLINATSATRLWCDVYKLFLLKMQCVVVLSFPTGLIIIIHRLIFELFPPRSLTQDHHDDDQKPPLLQSTLHHAPDCTCRVWHTKTNSQYIFSFFPVVLHFIMLFDRPLKTKVQLTKAQKIKQHMLRECRMNMFKNSQHFNSLNVSYVLRHSQPRLAV